MITNVVGYLGTRVAKRAVDSLERKIVWGATGAVLCTVALVFLMMAAYLYLSPWLGPVWSAGLLALVSAVLGVTAFFAPSILSWLETQAHPEENRAMGAIDEEAHAAVDYFGPLQVGLSAFMLGLNAGRSVRGTRKK